MAWTRRYDEAEPQRVNRWLAQNGVCSRREAEGLVGRGLVSIGGGGGEDARRQIRRMCDQVGLRVVDLLRIRIGPLSLGDLPEGRWRVLSAEERAAMVGAG